MGNSQIAEEQTELTITDLHIAKYKFLYDRLLLELKQPTNIDFQAEFERQYFRQNDGTHRHFPPNISASLKQAKYRAANYSDFRLSLIHS